ncbi:oligosaccharide flippase family protein [Priestia filamentosa]|uniref:oligosaccharide flippase family protein n=1 Tax=Priestia filamentosa TaxID=1402861 RepID=UPI003982B6C6
MQRQTTFYDLNNKVLKIIQWMIKGGFLHLLSANIIIQIVGFSGQLFLTRIVSVESIGILRIVQSYYSILIILGTFGINMAILKVCSEDLPHLKKKQIFGFGFYTSLVINFIIVALFIIVINLNFLTIDKETIGYLTIYNLQVPFFVLTSVVFAYYQAQQKVKFLSNFQSLTKVVVIVLSIFMAIWFGLKGYIYGLLIFNVIFFVILIILIKKEIVMPTKEILREIDMKSFFRIGIYSFGTNILWQILLYSNTILASYMDISKQQIAFYGMAHLIITTMMMIPMTLNQIMIPYISREEKDVHKVQILLKSYQKRMVLLVIPLCLLSYIFFPILIPILLGEDYIHSTLYFNILLFMFLSWSLFSPKMNVLMAVGKVKYNFYTYVISMIIYLSLNYILMNRYQMYGASIAIAITFFTTIFINNLFYLKYKKQSKELVLKDC